MLQLIGITTIKTDLILLFHNMNKKAITTLILLIFSSIGAYSQKLNQSLGNFTGIKEDQNTILINTSNGTLRAIVYSPTIIRISISQDSNFDDQTYAVVAEPSKDVKYKINKSSDRIILSTDSIDLNITKQPVRLQFLNKKAQIINQDDMAFGTSWIGEEITTYKKLQEGEKFIGLGEKTGNLNRRGEGYTNWNTDYYGYPTNADAIYQTLPFYIGIHSGLQYGIFMDNSFKSHFNFGASNNRFSSFSAEDGTMNYYFIYHSNVKGIISSYTHLTGRMEMPPLWSLGLIQARYSYYPEQEVLTLAKTYRDKKIPADGITLDIHYMDAYKIFTWDKQRFPNPKTMNSELSKMGFHTTVICDPGIKAEKGYAAYEDGLKNDVFLKYPDGTPYTGAVWPGWCHFPDFTKPAARTWWGNQFKGYVDAGVEGFWNDMNEPATWGNKFPDLVEFDFEGQKGTHRKGHNLYGIEMARSTYEGTKNLLDGKRPFLLTRAGYSGVQRYSAVWTGDNVASDDHLMTGIRLLSSMGLTGVPFTGMDVGGFTGNPTVPLFGRWLTIGAFSPYFRIHSGINTKESDPWSYGEKVEAISKNYIELRYKLLPYLYSTFNEAFATGLPVLRSLAIDYTHDNKIYDGTYQNQYFFGSALMVAPFESSKEFGKVYLPDANGWYSFYNDRFYQGKEEFITEAPIEKLPLFVKGGSIIPMQSLVQNTNEMPSDTLYLHVYNGKTGSSFTYYEDDGKTYNYQKGEYFRRSISFDPVKKSLVLNDAEGSFTSKFKRVKIMLHGFGNMSALKVNNSRSGTKNESIFFMNPLPHFDPQGTGGTPEMINVQTVVVDNGKGRISLSW
jgi:alpha-glucosidase